MSQDKSEIAINYLKKEDEVFYWDMIDPIQTGLGTVIEVDKDGVLLQIGKTWYVMAKTVEKAKEFGEIIQRTGFNVVCAHNEIATKPISETCGGIWYRDSCYVFVGTMEKFNLKTDLSFKKLGHDYDEFVWKTYGFTKNDPNGLEWAQELIDMGVYGAFKNDKIVGFIGSHDEGTMGLLEILPEYRRHGYGKNLEQYLSNVFIDSGRKPFCHVLDTNFASLALQKELGFKYKEDKKVYWMS